MDFECGYEGTSLIPHIGNYKVLDLKSLLACIREDVGFMFRLIWLYLRDSILCCYWLEYPLNEAIVTGTIEEVDCTYLRIPFFGSVS